MTIIASSIVTGRQAGAGSSIAGSVVTERQTGRKTDRKAGRQTVPWSRKAMVVGFV